ncbi:larval cuticle protein 65Ag1-like [Thrips palmi]|uniref:Larval cuticle protein 65Ag1-like n=1 Tax=Thrips palmi TaxID=161013 RepID=A0A6P8ZY41_THRPL|nr:larval cuticle protein 65Ag1-like [Thrips palmi]
MKCVVLSVFALVALTSAQQQRLQEPIAIVRLNSDVQPDGGFVYEYETAHGIKAEARGVPSEAGPEGPAVAMQGSYSFVGDDGQTYAVTYVADQNGYQPQGAHLPTPPPIPEAILRSLEFNAKYYKGEDDESLRAAKPAFGRN